MNMRKSLAAMFMATTFFAVGTSDVFANNGGANNDRHSPPDNDQYTMVEDRVQPMMANASAIYDDDKDVSDMTMAEFRDLPALEFVQTFLEWAVVKKNALNEAGIPDEDPRQKFFKAIIDPDVEAEREFSDVFQTRLAYSANAIGREHPDAPVDKFFRFFFERQYKYFVDEYEPRISHNDYESLQERPGVAFQNTPQPKAA